MKRIMLIKKTNPPNPLNPRFIEVPKQELSFATILPQKHKDTKKRFESCNNNVL